MVFIERFIRAGRLHLPRHPSVANAGAQEVPQLNPVPFTLAPHLDQTFRTYVNGIAAKPLEQFA
jgi:hypothetical protein